MIDGRRCPKTRLHRPPSPGYLRATSWSARLVEQGGRNRSGRACGRASACADASGPARAGGRPAQRAPTARVHAPAVSVVASTGRLKPRRPGLRPRVGLRRRVRTRPRRRAPGAARPHGARSRARLPVASTGRLKPQRQGLRPRVGLRRRVRTRPPAGCQHRAVETAAAGPAAGRRPAPTCPDPPAQAGARRTAPPRRACTRPPPDHDVALGRFVRR